MRKITLFLVGILFISQATFAGIHFGVKLGYNASKLSTHLDSIKSSFNSGFHVGVWMRIGNKFYLQPELLYTLQGFTFQNNVPNTVNNWKQKATIGSMDIPVLVGFRLLNLKVVKLHIKAGPEISFLVNSKFKDETLTGPIKSADLQKVNWYAQVGAGLDVLFLTFDLRYQIGLNQMVKSVQSGSYIYPFNSRNNLWVVSLGFKIF